MVKMLGLMVSGSFLVASVAFANGEEATGGSEPATTEAPPATTAAPAKSTTGRRPMKGPMIRPIRKADPEALKKVGECRDKCLTDKQSGSDRLTCFFGCRKESRVFAPYAGFKGCLEARVKCARETCKIAARPMTPAVGTTRPMAAAGGTTRPAIKLRRPGQGAPSGVQSPRDPARPPGQRPTMAGRPLLIKKGPVGHRPPVRPMLPRLTQEQRKCLIECGKANRTCMEGVLANATPSGGAATTTAETKTEAAPAETKTETTATTEPKTEETKKEEPKTEEPKTEETKTEGTEEQP